MAEQKDLEKRHQQDQSEIKRLQQELRRKDKALGILDAYVSAGARAAKLAELLGVELTTLQRWRRQFAGDGDGQDRRKDSPRHRAHRLSEEERQRILLTHNQTEPLRGTTFLLALELQYWAFTPSCTCLHLSMIDDAAAMVTMDSMQFHFIEQ